MKLTTPNELIVAGVNIAPYVEVSFNIMYWLSVFGLLVFVFVVIYAAVNIGGTSLKMSSPSRQNKNKYPKAYIGNCVYATYDGQQIILTRDRYYNNDDQQKQNEHIYLEPQDIDELVKFNQIILEYHNEINNTK